MNRVVADASFCGAWILPDETSETAVQLLGEIESGQIELVVPSIWIYEMGNLLKAACRRGRLTKAAARSAQELLNEVPLGICDVPAGKTRLAILKMCFKHDLSFYDGSYLELACRLKIPLQSNDIRLRQAADVEFG